MPSLFQRTQKILTGCIQVFLEGSKGAQPQRPAKGRQLLYLRSSNCSNESELSTYLRWGRNYAAREGLDFDPNSRNGNVFGDWQCAGSNVSRTGLDALIEEAQRDRSVSHVLVPSPDRLARSAVVVVTLECRFREMGVQLVFQTCQRMA